MNANLTQNFGLKYFLVVCAVTRVTYAIIDTIGLLGPDLQVALASANAPLRILNNLNKGSIHLIVCDDSKILIVTRLSKKKTPMNGDITLTMRSIVSKNSQSRQD